MINVQCSNRNDKPGKHEVVTFFKSWMTYKDCPKCDSKRIVQCNDPNCVRRKKQTKKVKFLEKYKYQWLTRYK